MRRDHRLYLDDILEAIGKIERYTEGLNIDQFKTVTDVEIPGTHLLPRYV